jgi:hypothetical protein
MHFSNLLGIAEQLQKKMVVILSAGHAVTAEDYLEPF